MGVEGKVKKMEIGCSEVIVMVQECRYDEKEFFHDKKRHTDARSCVRCSIGVGSFVACGYLGRDVIPQFMWRSPTSDSKFEKFPSSSAVLIALQIALRLDCIFGSSWPQGAAI